jgi:dihydroxyacetone kinase-like predicted kinase
MCARGDVKGSKHVQRSHSSNRTVGARGNSGVIVGQEE